MSRGNKIVGIRLTPDELIQIDNALYSRQKRNRKQERNLSSWIREAIQEKLDHIKRSRKNTSTKKFVCAHCGLRQPVSLLSSEYTSITGERFRICGACQTPSERSELEAV